MALLTAPNTRYRAAIDWCASLFDNDVFSPPSIDEDVSNDVKKHILTVCLISSDEQFLGTMAQDQPLLSKLWRTLQWAKSASLCKDNPTIGTIYRYLDDTCLRRQLLPSPPTDAPVQAAKRRGRKPSKPRQDPPPALEDVPLNLIPDLEIHVEDQQLFMDALSSATSLDGNHSPIIPPEHDNEVTLTTQLVDSSLIQPPFARNPLTASQKRKRTTPEVNTCSLPRPLPGKWRQWDQTKDDEFPIILTHKVLDPLACENLLIDNLDRLGSERYPFQTKIRDRHLLILCETEISRQKLFTSLTEIDSAFELHMPAKRQPRLRLSSVRPRFTVTKNPSLDRPNWEHTLNDIIKQNGLTSDSMLFVTAFSSGDAYDLIVQVTPRLRDALEKKGGHIYHNLKKILITDEFNVKMCLNCQSYGHLKSACQQQPRCKYCAAFHESAKCSHKGQQEKYLCASCSENHPNFSWACEKYRGMLKNEITKINYVYHTIMRRYD